MLLRKLAMFHSNNKGITLKKECLFRSSAHFKTRLCFVVVELFELSTLGINCYWIYDFQIPSPIQ